MSFNNLRLGALAIVALGALQASAAWAQGYNLAPRYQPRPETDSERLQNFRPPPPPPTTYPRISGGDRGDPRLYVNPDVSLGGGLSAGGAEGNVRFPIPGTRK